MAVATLVDYLIFDSKLSLSFIKDLCNYFQRIWFGDSNKLMKTPNDFREQQ